MWSDVTYDDREGEEFNFSRTYLDAKDSCIDNL